MNTIEMAGQEEGGVRVEVENATAPRLVSQNSAPCLISNDIDVKAPAEARNDLSSPKSNKRKLSSPAEEGQPKISHITVERNRRKQINDNLNVLRSLMPSFYVKRVTPLSFSILSFYASICNRKLYGDYKFSGDLTFSMQNYAHVCLREGEASSSFCFS